MRTSFRLSSQHSAARPSVLSPGLPTTGWQAPSTGWQAPLLSWQVAAGPPGRYTLGVRAAIAKDKAPGKEQQGGGGGPGTGAPAAHRWRLSPSELCLEDIGGPNAVVLEAQGQVCTGPTQTRPLTEEQLRNVLNTILASGETTYGAPGVRSGYGAWVCPVHLPLTASICFHPLPLLSPPFFSSFFPGALAPVPL